ncbi:uncharacterized protein [Parasteatoda tepidariorum]|uniref:uncharacterized protein isoform X2 n=1 Tax=Parasteatoda tepidariorum TaxID=114398 RepID=UPI00077FD14D|nr:uncharacterized protein LOC107436655 isoform X2 [Parasteatoda tepidariorum]
MREEDISQVIRLRRELTFQDCSSSYELCHKVDPQAFLVATDENERVIGFGSIKNSSDTLSTAGCMTIHPDYWNHGLAKKMILHHSPRVGNRNMTLLTEARFLPVYAPYTPILEKDYIIIDFESQEDVNPRCLSFGNQPNTEMQYFREEFISEVVEYDRKIIGFDRKEDVVSNCLDAYGRTVVAISGSRCTGYGSIKLNIQGACRVGPLYAETPVVAEAVLKKLLESFAYGKGFAASVPSNNLDAVRLFGKLGKMKNVNNFRMTSKERFVLDTSHIYAIYDGEFHPL